MDLVNTVRKSGSRGGVNFSWDDVATSSHRENYLGHSLKAPVGRWQKGRDLNWYASAEPSAADAGHDSETEVERQARERRDEIRRIKEAEDDAIARALGLPVPVRNATGANSVEVTGSRVSNLAAAEEAPGSLQEEGGRDREGHKKKRRSEKKDREGRGRDSERRHRHRHRDRDRDRDRNRERDRDRDRARGRSRSRSRSRSRERRRDRDRSPRRRADSRERRRRSEATEKRSRSPAPERRERKDYRAGDGRSPGRLEGPRRSRSREYRHRSPVRRRSLSPDGRRR